MLISKLFRIFSPIENTECLPIENEKFLTSNILSSIYIMLIKGLLMTQHTCSLQCYTLSNFNFKQIFKCPIVMDLNHLRKMDQKKWTSKTSFGCFKIFVTLRSTGKNANQNCLLNCSTTVHFIFSLHCHEWILDGMKMSFPSFMNMATGLFVMKMQKLKSYMSW